MAIPFFALALASLIGNVARAKGATDAARISASGFKEGRGYLEEGAERSRRLYQPYIDRGEMASDLFAAYSGALGPERQAQAFRDFEEDPGTQFLREAGEAAINRKASAMGNLLSSSRAQDLSRYNQGLALQDLSRRQGVLRDISRLGFSATGGAANVEQNLAANLYGSATGSAQARAQAAQQRGDIFGDFLSDVGVLGAYSYFGPGSTKKVQPSQFSWSSGGWADQSKPTWAPGWSDNLAQEEDPWAVDFSLPFSWS